MKGKLRNQRKKGTTMNPLTQFKKILILPLLIALSLIVVRPARATPACGLASQTLALGHFPNGSLNLMCNEFDQYGWNLKMMVKGNSDVYVIRNTWPVGAQWVAHASGSQPDHGYIWRAHGLRG